MNRTAKRVGSLAFCVAAVLTASAPVSLHADPAGVYVSGAETVDIRVWVDDTWDVHPSYADVTFSVRASRDCFATIFVIDTEGYVHVVHPSSRRSSSWLHQGRTYCFSGTELGLHRLSGRGIAYVFAVGSPYRFEYGPWGDGIFVGNYGYRVYGDPYIACRQLCMSLLPRSCRWDRIGVSIATFYVREWVRYPTYLCYSYYDHPVHVRFGGYCKRCSPVYDTFRVHAGHPYDVIKPRVKYKSARSDYAQIKRAGGRDNRHGRAIDRDMARRNVKRGTRIVSSESRRRTAASVPRSIRAPERNTRRITRNPAGSRSVTRKTSSLEKRIGRVENDVRRRLTAKRASSSVVRGKRAVAGKPSARKAKRERTKKKSEASR